MGSIQIYTDSVDSLEDVEKIGCPTHLVFQPQPFHWLFNGLSEGAAYHATHDSDAIDTCSDLTLNKHQAAMNIYKPSLQQVLSKSPSTEETESIMELWTDVYSIDNDPISAWQATLIYLFRHPYFLTY